MTDQLWENEEAGLSKKFIGKISNMKEFWSSVSDDDCLSREKNKETHINKGPFSKNEHLKENIQNKRERYINLVDAKNNGPESRCLSEDILDDNEIEQKRKCEKGNTKEHLTFWEGILEEKRDDDAKAPDKEVLGN